MYIGGEGERVREGVLRVVLVGIDMVNGEGVVLSHLSLRPSHH